MYRLLIVTEKQAVRDMFAAMEGWEAMGFKQPRLRATTAEALECMEKHHIDAIAVDDAPAYAELNVHLDANCPTMLRFPIMDTPEREMDVIRELDRMLGALNADHTNDEYDLQGALRNTRQRLMKTVLCGLIPTQAELTTKLSMLRCQERADVPCVVARLGMCTDDPFLTSRWHYGSDRLETALRNFFGVEHDEMLLHVAVISPEEVRVLCYPRRENAPVTEAAAKEYIRETVEQVEKYLGLEMRVMEICRLPGLTAFTAD